ncbi:phage portal protein [Alkalihalobacillus trypoxylicola]|uniref:Phage portal protein n=2 Tax=Alkalihalobacillus trypoxylicola TaxID=519424 RepID=A0A162EXK5_9BACI|nr:phage portal protein [Alkalihalobacillus trypoxylicola]
MNFQQAKAFFESQTFEAIMERMLERIPDNLDKRENSVIWNALSPAAAELAQSYIWIENIFDQAFADTAQGEFLEKRAIEAGIERQPATKAVWQGLFNIDIAPGTRFYAEALYFVALTNNQIQCETAGEEGNRHLLGQLLQPLDTIPNLTIAEIGDQLIPARDAEEDSSLYQRYLVRVRREAVSGNKEHYRQWAEEVDGVGRARVFPLSNGNGTVKIVIINANMQPASQALLDSVRNYIDPMPGQGEGQAPIGATLTVESAVYKQVQITADVLPVTGRTVDDVKREVEYELQSFFRRIAFEENVVRLSQIMNILYHAQSVSDYSNVLINGVADNLELLETEIPLLQEVIIHEQN